uniref:Uncharacterized protein n=1 Tax=Rhizophora mucronata TaxID=61149 RepID=A0A2P2IHK4_RHIMU
MIQNSLHPLAAGATCNHFLYSRVKMLHSFYLLKWKLRK